MTTRDLADGDWADTGDRLFTVDMRPVVVAAGQIPMYRDLGRGDQGPDVRQLQDLLIGSGYLIGPADGVFGGATERAVRAWHAGLGIAAAGADGGKVLRGDVVAVGALPARLALAEGVDVGLTLGGGEVVVEVLPAEPQMEIALTDGQRSTVVAGTAVELAFGDSLWQARVEEVQTAGGEEPARAVLAPADGASICGDECPSIPVDGTTLVPAEVIVVPEVEGLVVPAAALVSDVSGVPGVVLDDGTFQPVTVVASALGNAVVEGIEETTSVRVPGRLP
ncbi:peptidoglycan-binding protein [Cellulomonas sp. SLBN-39]|uniref:peptidoglycan-binding domain-containing protein n=1 Tax=Cellulomonas sp. SLBN-39 TaxID=2768446 RepID=UPI00135B3B62|nr:peptidoglycan-binding protein [Cellulomonas sp. SLBN-39]